VDTDGLLDYCRRLGYTVSSDAGARDFALREHDYTYEECADTDVGEDVFEAEKLEKSAEGSLVEESQEMND
jgi:hypothetical protein